MAALRGLFLPGPPGFAFPLQSGFAGPYNKGGKRLLPPSKNFFDSDAINVPFRALLE